MRALPKLDRYLRPLTVIIKGIKRLPIQGVDFAGKQYEPGPRQMVLGIECV